MKIDIQDVLFWMDAIRNSDNKYRTLESFWKGQVNSKIWLIENLEKYACQKENTISIYGGWNGVLSSLMFNSNIDIKNIISIDIDSTCEQIASTICKRQEIEGRFNAITANMCDNVFDTDIVINTSCEHITQEQYNQWLNKVNPRSLIVVQSNNYFELEEHIRCANNLDDFCQTSKIDNIYWAGEFQTQKYTRYMIIGKRNE